MTPGEEADEMGSEHGGGGLRILAVEDSPSARKVFQGVLTRLGVSLRDLRLASNSQEALQLFTQWRPDLVFVDVELSGGRYRPPPAAGAPADGHPVEMDGDELAKQMLARNPDLNLVVVTAYDRDNPRVKALLTTGAADVIVKPVLAARVQEILTRFTATPKRSSKRR